MTITLTIRERCVICLFVTHFACRKWKYFGPYCVGGGTAILKTVHSPTLCPEKQLTNWTLFSKLYGYLSFPSRNCWTKSDRPTWFRPTLSSTRWKFERNRAIRIFPIVDNYVRFITLLFFYLKILNSKYFLPSLKR